MIQRDPIEYKNIIISTSDAIRVTRIICIFFMTYVHVHLFSQADLEGSPQFQTALSIIRDVAGRASVPLLSIVSGFLIIGYLSRRSLSQAARNRAATLLVPIITWNLIGITIFAALDGLQQIEVNSVFPFTGHGFQHHLTFLRDLFVVSLLSPLLIRALKIAPVITVALIILVTALLDTWPVILRTQILMYFTFGLLFGLYRLEGTRTYRIGRRLAYVAFGMLLIHAALNGAAQLNKYFNFTTWIMQPISALTFWGIAQWITTKPSLLKIARVLEPAVFLLYLSHYITARFLAGAYAQLEFAHTPWIYTLTWMLIPPLCFFVAVIGQSLMSALPGMLSLAMTGKSPKQP